MTTEIAPLTARPAWQALTAHYQQVRELHLRQLFAEDPTRGERLTAEAVGIYLFVSNVDGTDFAEAVHDLDPAETLFITASKTFTQTVIPAYAGIQGMPLGWIPAPVSRTGQAARG
jgi:hypothetical protein